MTTTLRGGTEGGGSKASNVEEEEEEEEMNRLNWKREGNSSLDKECFAMAFSGTLTMDR